MKICANYLLSDMTMPVNVSPQQKIYQRPEIIKARQTGHI